MNRLTGFNLIPEYISGQNLIIADMSLSPALYLNNCELEKDVKVYVDAVDPYRPMLGSTIYLQQKAALIDKQLQ